MPRGTDINDDILDLVNDEHNNQLNDYFRRADELVNKFLDASYDDVYSGLRDLRDAIDADRKSNHRDSV